jgi:hypothetical protein
VGGVGGMIFSFFSSSEFKVKNSKRKIQNYNSKFKIIIVSGPYPDPYGRQEFGDPSGSS